MNIKEAQRAEAIDLERLIAAEVLTALDEYRESWASMDDDTLAQQLEEWSMAPTTNRADLIRYAALTIFILSGLEATRA